MGLDKITAPWSPQQIAALNDFQSAGNFHPFTCPYGHRPDTERILLATADGWICPDRACDYTQDWAHEFMAGAR